LQNEKEVEKEIKYGTLEELVDAYFLARKKIL